MRLVVGFFSLSSSVGQCYEIYQNYLMGNNFRDMAEINYDLPISLILGLVWFVSLFSFVWFETHGTNLHHNGYSCQCSQLNKPTKRKRRYTFCCTDTSVSVQFKDFFTQNEVGQHRQSKTSSVSVTVYEMCT